MKVTSTYYNGQPHQEYTDEIVAVERHADTNYDIVVIPVSKDNVLVPKVSTSFYFLLVATVCMCLQTITG